MHESPHSLAEKYENKIINPSKELFWKQKKNLETFLYENQRKKEVSKSSDSIHQKNLQSRRVIMLLQINEQRL